MIYTSDFKYFLFTFLTVGAGSAGCVLANRLSEDPESSVLLIEAGGSEDDNFNISIPIASGMLQKTEQDWKYQTIPQKKACLALHEKVWSSKHIIGVFVYYLKIKTLNPCVGK